MDSTKLCKQLIRKNIAKHRRVLAAGLKHKKARELLKTITPLTEFKQAKRIAFYWPFKGEINPLPILYRALKMGKRCYLPVLHPNKTKHLLFVEYRLGDKLRLNRYGIKEPRLGFRPALAARMLNTVFVPLLAFTQGGQRLGTGGGYYDKTFAFLLKGKYPLKLVGLSYEFQKLERIPHEKWDLLLWGIATEKQFTKPSLKFF